MKFSKNAVVLLICLLVVVGGGMYYFFFFNNDSSAAVQSDSSDANTAEQSFIALVSKLDPITFDTTLLSDPRFTALTDIRTTIVPETSGRKDPFAPI